MSDIKFVKNKTKTTPSKEFIRKCNICDEPILDAQNSMYTNRDAGYGNIGRAHDSCIAKRLTSGSS